MTKMRMKEGTSRTMTMRRIGGVSRTTMTRRRDEANRMMMKAYNGSFP
jgi:hypothetical protein